MLTTFDYEHQFINALVVVGQREYDTIFRYVFKPSLPPPTPPKPTSVVLCHLIMMMTKWMGSIVSLYFPFIL